MEDCAAVNSTLWRDLVLIASTFLSTCLGIALYNVYIHRRSRRWKKCEDLEDSKQGEKNVRDSENTSLAASLAHIEGMSASGKFLSAVLEQMWEQANMAVSNCIKNALDSTLRELPVPLHFVRLDLGDVPIKARNMFIHRVDTDGKRPPGIQIDVDVEWDGNCDVAFQATLAKSKKVKFGVKHLKLNGRMHILLSPLNGELPVVSAVQYGFINPPDISLRLTGIARTVAKRLGFVRSALISVIQSSLAGKLVLPNRMVMPVDLGGYDFLDTYQPPVGMIRIKVIKGGRFQVLQKCLLNDIPDVYCMISLGASDKFRTSTKANSCYPRWSDESCDFILYDMDQKVYIECWDEDTANFDSLLGKGTVSARTIFRKGGTAELELELSGEQNGSKISVAAELFQMTNSIESFTSPSYEGKGCLCGLATIIVTQAFDIPLPKEDCATYVKVIYGEGSDHEKTFFTGTVSDYPGFDAQNPMYDCVFHVPIDATMLRGKVSGSSPSKSVSSSSVDEGDFEGEIGGDAVSSVAKSLSSRRPSLDRMISRKKRPINNDITFVLIDTDGANDTKGQGELGRTTVTHAQLCRVRSRSITGTRTVGTEGAKVEFRVALSGEFLPWKRAAMPCGFLSDEERLSAMKASRARESRPGTLDFVESTHGSLYNEMDGRGSVTVRVTIMHGRGFKIPGSALRERPKPLRGETSSIKKRRSTDKLKASGNMQREALAPWRTSTIEDDTMPQWNESRDFGNIKSSDILRVDAFGEEEGADNIYLGTAELSVERLLRKRLMEVELLNEDGLATQVFVTLRGILRSAQAAGHEVDNVAVDGSLMNHSQPQKLNSLSMPGAKTAAEEEEVLIPQWTAGGVSWFKY
ncbi:hypothetical protein ACHAWF_016529 [Thalassiosira exigua]